MDEPALKYTAFISYRHAEPDRTWARWLQSALERYRVPGPLVRRNVPARVGTVFRDEEELAASASLSREIEQALAQSRFLIVICSPRTPESAWIAEEITRFRQLGRADRILALLLEGEPVESFPRALLDLSSAGEPLAADVRPRSGESPRTLKRTALLRLLAPLLGCRFDDLRQREQDRRIRRWMQTAGVLGALFVIVGALSMFAWHQWGRAEDQATIARRELAAVHLAAAVNARDGADEPIKAAHHFIRAAAVTPDLTLARNARFAAGLLIDGVRLTAVFGHDGPVRGAAFSGDGERVVTWSGDGTARVWSPRTGRPLSPPLQHTGPVNGAAVARDGRRILTWSVDGTSYVWDSVTGAAMTAPMKHAVHNAYAQFDGTAFDPTERRVITWRTGAADGEARVWDGTTGAPLTSPLRHEGIVFGASLLTDTDQVVTWGGVVGGDLTSGSVRFRHMTGEQAGPPLRHDGAVRGVVFDRPRRRILTWSNDGSVRLWSEDTHAPVGAPLRHRGPVMGATLSADGRSILSWTGDEFFVWDTTTGARVAGPLKEKNQIPTGAIYSRHADRVLTWAASSARVWDGRDGRPLTAPMQHRNKVYGATFTEDERRIVTWSADATARLWDARSGEPVRPRLVHGGAVLGVAMDRDQRLLLTWSQDGLARLWERGADVPMSVPLAHANLAGARFSADGQRVVTWDFEGTVRVWNGRDGSPVSTSRSHTKRVRGTAFSADGRRVLSWSEDATARLLETETGRLGPPMAHPAAVSGAVLSRDERRVLAWSTDGVVRVWDASTSVPVTPPLVHEDARARGFVGAGFSADGQWVISHSAHSIRVWDAKAGTRLVSIERLTGPIWGAVYSPSERSILSWGFGDAARVWEARSGRPLIPVLQHGGVVAGIMLDRDEKWVLTWSNDATARVWDARTGVPRTQPLRHEAWVEGARFNADASRVLTWSGDGTARVWDAVTGQPISITGRHQARVTGATFSRDERRFLTMSWDGSARVWETITGHPVTPPLLHESTRFGRVVSADGQHGAVIGAQFSADGARVLTWSEDGTARLWDSRTGTLLSPRLEHAAIVQDAILSRDELRLLTVGGGFAKLWNLEAREENLGNRPILAIELSTGTRLDSTGDMRVLPLGDWQRRREDYASTHFQAPRGAPSAR